MAWLAESTSYGPGKKRAAKPRLVVRVTLHADPCSRFVRIDFRVTQEARGDFR